MVVGKLDLAKQVIADVQLQGTAGATAGNYGLFFTAPFPCRVISVTERHEVLGTDAGAVTLQVNKVPSGTAKASGTAVLASTINLKGTINTNQSPAIVSSSAADLVAGDSLALILTGTPTAVAGVSVTVQLQRL